MDRREEGAILLPVKEWLITKEPLPLSIDGVVDGCIREHRVGRVVCVVAGGCGVGGPVAVVCACWVSLASGFKFEVAGCWLPFFLPLMAVMDSGDLHPGK